MELMKLIPEAEQAQAKIKLRTLHDELVKASDPDEPDTQTVERCVRDIRQVLGVSNARLGALIGVSDQTVLRWQHHKPPYEKSIPSKAALQKLTELIEGLGATKGLPDRLPAAYFQAVAETKKPCLSYLRILMETERIVGTELDEETCRAILRNVEKSDEQ